MYRDVVEIMCQAGEFVDTLLIPKVGVEGMYIWLIVW
jgi:hypothetical protein